MKKKNIILIVILILAILVIAVVLLLGDNKSNKSYVDFNDLNTPEPTIEVEELATGVYIEKEVYDNVDMPIGNSNDTVIRELSEKDSINLIAEEMERQGLKGGITHEYYEDIGESDYPEDLVDNKGYTDWYTLTTDNGVMYAIIKDGVVIISRE